jgi:hypothetical protein
MMEPKYSGTRTMALEIRRQDRFALGYMKIKKRIRRPTEVITSVANKKTKLRIM